MQQSSIFETTILQIKRLAARYVIATIFLWSNYLYRKSEKLNFYWTHCDSVPTGKNERKQVQSEQRK